MSSCNIGLKVLCPCRHPVSQNPLSIRKQNRKLTGLVPQVTIFLVIVLAIFLLPNKAFAWFEYVTSVIKIFLFLLIIVLSLAIVCGAGPGGYVHDGAYWRDLPAFKNGFTVGSLFFPVSSLLTLSADILRGSPIVR